MKRLNLLITTKLAFAVMAFAQDTLVQKTNFEIGDSTNEIYGSLTEISGAKQKNVVVLLIAGSGPTDRNGDNIAGVKCNSYAILCDSLLKYGIPSLRYDKRGAAQSGKALKSEASLVFDDYVNDVVAIVNKLQTVYKYKNVVIAGHSEGSLIGMLAAKKARVVKYISLCGPAEAIQVTLKKQLATQPEKLKNDMYTYLDTLAMGKTLTNVPMQYYSLFRPSAQPYMISWMKYSPVNEIASLKIPVLIVAGTTDIQVETEDAQKLKTANKKATLLVVEGMSHLLKDGPADKAKNAALYTKISNEPVKTELIAGLVKFIKGKSN
jgi:uncharacterized protein